VQIRTHSRTDADTRIYKCLVCARRIAHTLEEQAVQKETLGAMCSLAVRLGKPLLVESVEADADIAAVSYWAGHTAPAVQTHHGSGQVSGSP